MDAEVNTGMGAFNQKTVFHDEISNLWNVIIKEK